MGSPVALGVTDLAIQRLAIIVSLFPGVAHTLIELDNRDLVPGHLEV